MEVNNIKKRKIIFKNQKNIKRNKKFANKKLTRSTPNKEKKINQLKKHFQKENPICPRGRCQKIQKLNNKNNLIRMLI